MSKKFNSRYGSSEIQSHHSETEVFYGRTPIILEQNVHTHQKRILMSRCRGKTCWHLFLKSYWVVWLWTILPWSLFNSRKFTVKNDSTPKRVMKSSGRVEDQEKVLESYGNVQSSSDVKSLTVSFLDEKKRYSLCLFTSSPSYRKRR